MSEIEILAGTTIFEAAKTAIFEAIKTGRDVRFKFNGIEITAYPQSLDYDLVTIYGLKAEMQRMKATHA